MTLTLDDFTPYFGQPFALVGNDAAPFVLAEATGLVDRSGGQATRPPFVLLFTATDPVVRGQGSYTLHHPTLSQVDIFLVPVARTGNTLSYEAVFN